MVFLQKTSFRKYACAQSIWVKYLLVVTMFFWVGGAAAQDSPPSVIEEAGQAFQAGDVAKAVKLLQGAANTGNAEAAHTLGHLYEKGNGVAVDLPQALRLYLIATASNPFDAEASYHVGSMYKDGKGSAVDRSKAIRFLTASADLGFPQAMETMVVMLISSESAAESDLAIKYLGQLTAQGNQSAKKIYSQQVSMRALARPNRSNNAAYREYLRLAAAQGEASAQRALGEQLYNRLEIDEAIRYFEMARAQGVDVSKQLADARSDRAILKAKPVPDFSKSFMFCLLEPAEVSLSSYADPAKKIGNAALVDEVKISSMFIPDHGNWGLHRHQFGMFVSASMTDDSDCSLPTTQAKAEAQLKAAIAIAKKSGLKVTRVKWPD